MSEAESLVVHEIDNVRENRSHNRRRKSNHHKNNNHHNIAQGHKKNGAPHHHGKHPHLKKQMEQSLTRAKETDDAVEKQRHMQCADHYYRELQNIFPSALEKDFLSDPSADLSAQKEKEVLKQKAQAVEKEQKRNNNNMIALPDFIKSQLETF